MLKNKSIERIFLILLISWTNCCTLFTVQYGAKALLKNQNIKHHYDPYFANYSYHKVIQIESLNGSLNEWTDNLTASDGFDIWEYANNSIQALVSPYIFHQLQKNTNFSLKILDDNLQEWIDLEHVSNKQSKAKALLTSNQLDSWFNAYHTYDETKDFYKLLSNLYPSMCEYIPSIGKTFENRDIFAIKIGHPESPSTQYIYLQGLQHAREWLAGSTVNYLAYSLLTDTSARVKTLLQSITFIIVPIVNPDGYEYTWTNDRLWRKNRIIYQAPNKGVDLNRNWDSFFSTTGYSTIPSSDTYQGPFAASEAEVEACQNLYNKYRPRILGALDIHSFSQMLLWPWSYTSEHYKYRKAHQEIGSKMANAIRSVSNRWYTAMDSSSLYPSGGAAQDFFCDPKYLNNHNNSTYNLSAYSFTIELRPKSNDQSGVGFIVLPSQIIETGKEIFSGLLIFAEHALQHPIIA